MPSSFNRGHGFGVGLACVALTLGSLTLALLGHWVDALLLYGAVSLAFAVLFSLWMQRQGKPGSTPTRLVPARSAAKIPASVFRPHAH